ncbi:MAG: hypothetical protein ACLFVL_02205 [Candidatus Aenigmatarchaeota archaeon]
MDKEGKRLVEEALRNQRPHERFNKALSRTVSDKKQGKEGYKLYVDLMEEIRELARKEDIEVEKGAKKILGKL